MAGAAAGHGALTALEALHAGGRGLPLWLGCQGLAMAAAFGWFWARTYRQYSKLWLLLLVSFGGAVIGAAVLGVLVRVPAWLRHGGPASQLLGGVVAYGALGGLVLTFAALLRWRRQEVYPALDRLAPCLGVLVIVGRAGCFFAGCDFGKVSAVPWAVRFPRPAPAFADHLARGLVLASDHRSLPVHPVQIYEALLGAAMVIAALLAERRSPARGVPFWTAAAVYAAGRLVLEDLRGDITPAIAWGPWTSAQWISAVLLAAAIIHIIAPPRRAAAA